jgi:thiamine biosynthesis protein ThiI
MREVILLKYGELILKGLNRPVFEDILFKKIRRSLYKCGKFSLTQAQSTICLTPLDESFDIDEALIRLQKVFGIISIARACVVGKDINEINTVAAAYLKDTLEGVKTFKVAAKRSDKRFPLTSPQIMVETGGYLLDAFPHLKVDVHNPEIVVMVEIRDFSAYVHAGSIPGAGGMPSGSNGRAALLISGGIDSPVAGYMMAKRGIALCAVHFASPPYTSERAKIKVLDLLRQVALYSGRIICYVVPFTKIQEAIKDNCPEEYFTLIMRRFMMKVTSRLAEAENCTALITGESLGQVASQTMDALACTQAASSMQVFRPLIGMDKEEIVTVARKIGTFEISILPYEDCCTVFTPRHPRTKPKLSYVEAAESESGFNFDELLEEAIAGVEKIAIGY